MVTIRRVLCPVDFSEFSRHALARAVGIAKGCGASVTALHVVPIQPSLRAFHLEAAAPAPLELTPAEREHLLGELNDFVAPERAVSVPIDVAVVEAPTVQGEILAQAGRLGADLVVMGTHGRTGFERLILGSITEKVLRTARQPVLTVGAASGARQEGALSFTRILCAIDFSECSIGALKFAASLAAGANAMLTAVNVIEWTPIGYDPLVGPPIDLAGYRMSAEATARKRLHDVIVGTVPAGREVQAVVTSGKPHHEILRIASEQGSDLIVLGMHGRNPIDRMVFGSTAEPVVRRATCPVLTVRADLAAETAT
jgi:nucleotide-binding universal stress UspA family protein